MSYTRVNWQNYPNTSTPINATNLNKMDAGIADIDSRVTVLEEAAAAGITVDNILATYGTAIPTTATQFTMTEDYDDYDLLIVGATFYANILATIIVSKYEFSQTTSGRQIYITSSGTTYTVYHTSGSTNKVMLTSSGTHANDSLYGIKIWGIKLS